MRRSCAGIVNRLSAGFSDNFIGIFLQGLSARQDIKRISDLWRQGKNLSLKFGVPFFIKNM